VDESAHSRAEHPWADILSPNRCRLHARPTGRRHEGCSIIAVAPRQADNYGTVFFFAKAVYKTVSASSTPLSSSSASNAPPMMQKDEAEFYTRHIPSLLFIHD
jgi:hypothetical protein